MTSKALRIYSKCVCVAVFFLIFAGSIVTSMGAGLSVPDWPLSYGMLFPPMVGGVLYEHGHRLIATTVGCLTIVLTIWIHLVEKRQKVRWLGYTALLLVVCQGLLGGLTVLFFLPTAISAAHAVVGQTFFIVTILIAYMMSEEWMRKPEENSSTPVLFKVVIGFIPLVYIQLIVGAVMRHSNSGLAIPDFPKNAGYWIPLFNQQMLEWINVHRFSLGLDPVAFWQVLIHATHRFGGYLIFIGACVLLAFSGKAVRPNRALGVTIFLMVIVQICLAAATIWTVKSPWITSLHVLNGAAILGVSVVMALRVYPVRMLNS